MNEDTSMMKILQTIKRRSKAFIASLFIFLVVTLGLVLSRNDDFMGVTAKIMLGYESEELTGEYNQLTGEPIYEEVIKFGGSSISEQQIVFYTELLENPNLLEEVIETVNLDYSVEELSSLISIVFSENSSTMVITLGSEEIENPIDVIEELVVKFEQEAAEITDVDKLKVMDISNEPHTIQSGGFTRNIIASIIISFFAAGAIVLIIEYLDDSIHSALDIENRLSIYVIGELESEETLEEDLKVIRTNFEYSNQLKDKSVFTFASLDNHTDNISVDFFRVLEQLEHKILLADANLRNPEVHEKLGIPNTVGLSDALSAKATVDKNLQVRDDSLGNILTAGSELTAPSEQLSSSQVKILFDELKQSYDYVIVNGHPITEVADTLALSTATDGIVLVVEQNTTKMKDLAQVARLLANINVDLLGVIFSKI